MMTSSKFMSKKVKAKFAKELIDRGGDSDPVLLKIIKDAKEDDIKIEQNKRQASS